MDWRTLKMHKMVNGKKVELTQKEIDFIKKDEDANNLKKRLIDEKLIEKKNIKNMAIDKVCSIAKLNQLEREALFGK